MGNKVTNPLGSTPVFALAFGAVGDEAQTPSPGSPLPTRPYAPNLTPKGYFQIVGLNAVQTLAVPAGATSAVIQAEAQAVRWRDDGTAPSATVGMTIAAGGELLYDGNLAALKFIEVAASAKLNVSFYA